jgi:hypothetical protein
MDPGEYSRQIFHRESSHTNTNIFQDLFHNGILRVQFLCTRYSNSRL